MGIANSSQHGIPLFILVFCHRSNRIVVTDSQYRARKTLC